MYIEGNPKTKKMLKEWVKEGREVRVFSPGMFPAKTEGTEYVSGPHYPKPHSWYAQVELVEGIVVKVK